MNKTAVKSFAVWARRKLISEITYRAGLLGVTENGAAEPLPQSTKDLQFFDVGTKKTAEVQGAEIAQRGALVAAIQSKARDMDYKAAFQSVAEEVAYTWFNRMAAIRFMEVNDYLPSRIRVLSSENPGKLEPDFVTTPFDAGLDLTPAERDRVLRLKDENRLDELFRMLFIKQCNKLHELLPELFEATSDYTELLLTLSFTDKDGVVYHLTHDIPESDFDIAHTDENGKTPGQVEIIGWLYQYYNTELNDLVYDGSMSKQRIPKELLPAATTIYTPDWAIKYMVENSLGRLWLEGHPNDALKSGWSYYLEEAEQQQEVQAQLAGIREGYAGLSPENIKLIDPCMGSGHILVYAFDVLMQIYEAQGYTQRDAARLIVEKNLYGLDINRRAYQLACFAVMMKARQYNRRILTDGVRPNLYAIEDSAALTSGVLDFIANGSVKLRADLQSIADDLAGAKEYGSIIDVSPVDFDALLGRFEEIRAGASGDLFEAANRQLALNTVLPLVRQAQAMAQKYDVVCTNPPYLGSSRFSTKLNDYVVANYSDVKSDLSMVMYKHALRDLCQENGFVSFITTTSWMFLSSFEKLRNFVLSNYDFESLVEFGTELFDGKVGHNPIAAWVNRKSHTDYAMTGIRLVDYCYSRRDEKEIEFFNKKNYHYPKQSNFSKIPGSPIAYWVSENFIKAFDNSTLNEYVDAVKGLDTCDNTTFVRYWPEVAFNRIGFHTKSSEETYSYRWYPYCKGGGYSKWYGFMDKIVNWENDGTILRNLRDANGKIKSRPQNIRYYFRKGLTWSTITSYKLSLRYMNNCIFGGGGSAIFTNQIDSNYVLGFINSKVTEYYLSTLNPTLNFLVGDILLLPLIYSENNNVKILSEQNIMLSRDDWNSYETSWDFKKHPLI